MSDELGFVVNDFDVAFEAPPSPSVVTVEDLRFLKDCIDRDFLELGEQDRADRIVESLIGIFERQPVRAYQCINCEKITMRRVISCTACRYRVKEIFLRGLK